MCGSRKSKLISPLPGSCRSGTSASCMWPMRGSSRSMVFARSPSTTCMWKMSYCSRRLSAPTASITAIACVEVFRKKPGMARGLAGSVSSVRPACFSLAAAWRRLPTRVSNNCSLGTSAGATPASAFMRGQPAAVAYSMARSTPSRNSPTRAGWHAMPRSPLAASPAGRLCSTTCTPASRARSATCAALPRAYGNWYSTNRNPARAAAAKRSRNGSCGNSSEILAASRGMGGYVS